MNGIFPGINKNDTGLMPKKPHGFTMIEVLVVMAIMVILSGMVFALVGPVQERNAIASTGMLLARINSGLEMYKDDYGEYPDSRIPEVAYVALYNTEPGWRYQQETEAGEMISSTQIQNRYLYQESSFVLWKALVYDPRQRGEEPYVEYPSANIDKETLRYYDEVDSYDIDDPYQYPSRREDWRDVSNNTLYYWGDSDDEFQFGFLDYWGEPLIYLYWPDDDRPATAPKAVPGFEESYELWSAGPDKLFGDFFAEGEDDRDADNIAGVRMPTGISEDKEKNKTDRYDP